MYRPDISRLEENRNLHLKLGFLVAISLVALAFSYTTEMPAPYVPTLIETVPDDVATVVRTAQPKQIQLPPPVLQPTEELTPVEVEFTEEPIPVERTVEALPVEVELQPTLIPAAPVPKPKISPATVAAEEIPEIFEAVEHMPLFGDCAEESLSKSEKAICSNRALLQYLAANVQYPAIARETGIEGTVVVRFVVDERGQISDPNILKDIGGGCAQEALRVVKKMPRWEPGRQRHRKVKVYFNLPVRFVLK